MYTIKVKDEGKRGANYSMAAKKDELLKEIVKLEKQIKQVKSSIEDVAKAVKSDDEEKVKTYIRGFDGALDGGIQKKHIVLISGTSGTLKSSLGLSILYNNLKNKGLKGLYISLEESKDSLLQTMKGLNMNDFNEEDLMVVDVGRMRTDYKEADQQSDWIGIIEKYLEKKIKTAKISLVVLDSLTALTSFSSAESVRKDIFQFFNFLKKLGVTSFLITELNTTFNNGAIVQNVEEFLSDGLINVGFYEVNGRVELRIRCIKLRHSNHIPNYFILSHEDGGFAVTPIDNNDAEKANKDL